MLSDIQIAQQTEMLHIRKIAERAGVAEEYLEQYGNYKAKIDLSLLNTSKPDGKLVLVTAITPTPAGEGKTTTTVGLADALRRIGKNSVVALREPSLGPVFGVKGGAAGGGYAQVVPMEDINLHFTGDFHAIGAANNLLAAMLDNHIYQGNALRIDPRRITWKRCVDMNDRQLRFVVDGLGGRVNGTPREDGYDITVASEIMAVLCLATSIADLKERLSRIIVGYTYDEQPVTAGDLKAAGAMAALLKDALKPNLVQTLEHTPALIHGGPFANIAHGCNSVLATRMALKLGDYAVTEAGFGADLGAEKFLDIKCRMAGLRPAAVVVVATVRALKLHGGLKKDELKNEDLAALEKGLPNLLRHVSNITNVYGLPLRGGHQPLPGRYRGGTETGRGKVPRAGRERGSLRGLGQGRRRRRGAGRGSGAPLRGGKPLPVQLRPFHDHRGKAQCHRPPRLRRRGRGAAARGEKAGAPAHGAGLWRPPRLRGQDAIQLFRRPEEAGRAGELYYHRAQPARLGGRGLHRRPHRRHHDHARPAQSPRRGEHRRGRNGQDHGAVLKTHRILRKPRTPVAASAHIFPERLVNMGTDFRDYLNEQLRDPAFKAEYDALEPEFAIRQAIIDARRASGMTQKELAERTGIAQGDISKLENGSANPSLRTLQRLAAGMGMKVEIAFTPLH